MPTKFFAALAGMGAALLTACGGGSSVQAPKKGARTDASERDRDRLETWSGSRNLGNAQYRVEVVLDKAN